MVLAIKFMYVTFDIWKDSIFSNQSNQRFRNFSNFLRFPNQNGPRYECIDIMHMRLQFAYSNTDYEPIRPTLGLWFYFSAHMSCLCMLAFVLKSLQR